MQAVCSRDGHFNALFILIVPPWRILSWLIQSLAPLQSVRPNLLQILSPQALILHTLLFEFLSHWITCRHNVEIRKNEFAQEFEIIVPGDFYSQKGSWSRVRQAKRPAQRANRSGEQFYTS